jgi:hypothetical protein
MTKQIKFKDLVHHDHCDVLTDLNKMAIKGFDFVMLLACREILSELRGTKTQKLKKSDDSLKPGWTGQVPKIDIDFASMFDRVLGKYFSALQWILMGDLAGKEARENAEDIGLDNEVIPGIVPAAYLNIIDSNRQHFKAVFDKEAPAIKNSILKESLEQMNKRVARFAETSLDRLKNGMITAAENVAQQQYGDNVSAVHQRAHELVEQGVSRGQAVEQAVDSVTSDKLAMPQVSRALREAVEHYRKDWVAMAEADTSTASAVGTHQAMTEVFGAVDKNVRVAFIAFRDEKTCTFCKSASRRNDGSIKIYSMTDFEPAGYNHSRKRALWKLAVPPAHYNCRCMLVFVPEGFTVRDDGTLIPE